jgi:hypothetical protein
VITKYLCCVGLLIVASCHFFDSANAEKKSRVIARVNDVQLYEDDLQKVFPHNIPKKDSIVIARDFINNWAKEQLLLEKSILNLPEENENLNELVETYRKDLFINSFKEALIKQRLDTVVTEQEIISYYNKNKENFRTNEELIKFRFVKVKQGDKNISKLKRLLVSNGKNDLQLLDEQSALFEDYFLSDSIWIRSLDFFNKVPTFREQHKITTLQPYRLLQKNIEGSTSLVYINEVLQKNEIAPIRYISGVIKTMILHQRKLQLVETIEKVLIDDAIKKKQFEIY